MQKNIILTYRNQLKTFEKNLNLVVTLQCMKAQISLKASCFKISSEMSFELEN
jgi:hypothetical protein